MEYKQQTPSVLAGLMGVAVLPRSHPVLKRQRVLSESYLRRVASIGVREKLVERHSFGLNVDKQKEYANVFGFSSSSKRAKHNANSNRKRGGKLSSDAVVSQKSMEVKPMQVQKRETFNPLFTSVTATRIGSLKQSLGKLDNNAVTSQQISNNLFEVDKSNNQAKSVGSFRTRSRFSKEKSGKMGRVSAEIPQSKVMGEQISAEDTTSSISPSRYFTNIKNKSFCSDEPVVTISGNKQILERCRRTKKFQQVELSCRRKTGQGCLPIDDDDLNANPFGTSSPDCCLDWQEILKPEDDLENKGRTEDSCKHVSSASSITVLTAQSGALKGTQHNHEEQCVSEKDDYPALSLNISVQQDKAGAGFEEESVTPNHSVVDPESPFSLEEIYQPSPNSVLGPFYREEIIACPDCFKSTCDSLHGLQMHLELLKSETSDTYSEVSSMILSSDDDIEEGSVSNPAENEILKPFELEESRDFSYLVDVLTEAGLHSKNLQQICLETWHSGEGPINFSVFETLEKKYGEQMYWKRSERRLLFDRINLALTEISLPAIRVPEWKKPVAGRFSSKNGRVLIEEELWTMLVNEEKEALKNTEQDLGKEEKMADLTEEIREISRDIENSLIDELMVDRSGELLRMVV